MKQIAVKCKWIRYLPLIPMLWHSIVAFFLLLHFFCSCPIHQAVNYSILFEASSRVTPVPICFKWTNNSENNPFHIMTIHKTYQHFLRRAFILSLSHISSQLQFFSLWIATLKIFDILSHETFFNHRCAVIFFPFLSIRVHWPQTSAASPHNAHLEQLQRRVGAFSFRIGTEHTTHIEHRSKCGSTSLT